MARSGGECCRTWVCAVIFGAALLPSPLAISQSSSASYQVTRQSIDAGKARSASAHYLLEGTIGQPEAAPGMTSASYTLNGGFHRAAPQALADPLFSNGFE